MAANLNKGFDLKLIHKVYQTIDSTQDEIKKLAHEITQDTYLLCTAEEQTKGRGTKSRRWLSPPFVNIYATYGFLFQSPQLSDLTLIPQVAAYSVLLTLQELYLDNVSVKWVNDVLLDNKKICGILSEATQHQSQNGYIVYLGIGLNVNMEKNLCDSLEQPVTSLKAHTGITYDKNSVLSILNKHLMNNMAMLMEHGFQDFYRKISSVMAFKNERIFFDTEDEQCSSRTFYAKAIGIAENGALILEPELPTNELNKIRGVMPLPSNTSTTSSNQIQVITGRILRGNEITSTLVSSKETQRQAPTPSKSIYQANKWKIAGGAAALLATYGLYRWHNALDFNSNATSSNDLPRNKL